MQLIHTIMCPTKKLIGWNGYQFKLEYRARFMLKVKYFGIK